MLLGIDFDNTIVCYDALFHRVALEDGWIPASLPANKSDVRNHLRRIGREDVWTEMQGRVYGPRLAEAEPFPGVLDFLRLCRTAGLEFCIISHKTRTPFAGQPHDLHQAAWNWLETRGFFNPSDIALPRSRVFLELTKQAKLQRIAACACSAFIDDLPEFLAEPAFPASTRRILFDPNRLYGPEIPFERLHSWLDAPNRLLPTPTPPPTPSPTPAPAHPHPEPPLAQAAALIPGEPTGTPRLHPIAGGRNNRVYLVDPGHGSTPYVLKQYFLNPADPRDRFAAEHAFYRWIHLQAIQRTPKPAAWDVPNRLALFHLAPGRKLLPGEPAPHHIDQAVAFIRELNSHRLTPEAASLPNASEACFSISDHLSRIQLRVERLTRLQPHSDTDRAALDFIRSRLQPRWSRLQTSLTSQLPAHDLHPLPQHHRCLSPSDFGFHNALLDDQDTLRFLDFEYAGWDDPAKLVCDFFCQPQVPVDLRFWDQVVQPLGQALDQPSSLAARARFLLPAYRIKWCCILLNEFLASDSSRRAFADNSLATEHRKAAQLDKARRTLESLESLGSP